MKITITAELVKVGDGHGVIIPDEHLQTLGVGVGDELEMVVSVP